MKTKLPAKVSQEVSIPTQLDRLFSNLMGYVETYAKLVKVEIKNEVGKTLTSVIVGLGAVIFGLLAIAMLSVALSVWLGNLLDSMPLGFVISAGVHLLIAVIIILSRNAIKRVVGKALATNEEKDEEEDNNSDGKQVEDIESYQTETIVTTQN